QLALFSGGCRYHFIATNLKVEAEGVVWRYNERAKIERVIKQLKSGFEMDYMPTGEFGVSNSWFALGVLA
ncbi:MAG: IS1380 family transposase, partial [Caldimicrobium sp.]|nr:IS1380 family transposase [Caldimicrobium sp.]